MHAFRRQVFIMFLSVKLWKSSSNDYPLLSGIHRHIPIQRKTRLTRAEPYQGTGTNAEISDPRKGDPGSFSSARVRKGPSTISSAG